MDIDPKPLKKTWFPNGEQFGNNQLSKGIQAEILRLKQTGTKLPSIGTHKKI